MGLVIGMIEAGACSAATIDIDFRYLGETGDALHHDRESIVVVPGEEVHLAGLHLRGNGGDHIEARLVRGAEVLEEGIPEILLVIVEEGSAGAKLTGSAVLAVVGEWNWTTLCGAVRVVVVGIGKDSVDVTLLLQRIERLVDAFVNPHKRLHLNADKVFAIDGFGAESRDLFGPVVGGFLCCCDGCCLSVQSKLGRENTQKLNKFSPVEFHTHPSQSPLRLSRRA